MQWISDINNLPPFLLLLLVYALYVWPKILLNQLKNEMKGERGPNSIMIFQIALQKY